MILKVFVVLRVKFNQMSLVKNSEFIISGAPFDTEQKSERHFLLEIFWQIDFPRSPGTYRNRSRLQQIPLVNKQLEA